MSQHRGNDMITEDSSQGKGHFESPTLPTPTENTDIDDILGDLFVATHGGKTAHDVEDEDKLDAIDFANTAEILKAAIEQKLTKARMEHSIGILDNVIMLGKDLEYSKEELVSACIKQRDALQASKEGK